jgi:predicted ester cyclase
MKAFVRNHFEDFVNKRNAAVIHTNMTSDFYDHDGPGGKPTGVDGDEKMMLAMYKAMPDLHLEIEDMITEGDKVMCRNIWRWTDTASGKKMQFHGFVLGALKETRSPSAGPRSRSQPMVQSGPGVDEVSRRSR